MKRKSCRKFAEHGGQARTIAFVAFRVVRPLLIILSVLGSILMLPVQQVAFERAAFGGATLSMGSVAQPLLGHLDAALTGYAKGYQQNGLVADRMFPRVGVSRQTDKYYIFDRTNQKQGNTLRAFGAPAERIRLSVSNDSYFTESHAEAIDLPDEAKATDQTGILERQSLTSILMDRILLDKEIRAAAIMENTAVVTGNVTLAGGDQWSDFGASKPGTVIDDAKSVIRKSGVEANLMVIGEEVFNKLIRHPVIRDHYKYTSNESPSIAQLAGYFGVPELLVARAVKVSAANVASFVWGKHAWLMYVSPTPGRRDISAAKTFVWENGPGTMGGIGIVEGRHPDPTAKTDILGADFYYDQKVTAVETIYLVKNAVA